MRILVVEDDDLTSRVLVQLLRLEGHDVDEANDSDAASARLDAGRYEALVTDHHIRGVTGLELARRAQRASPGIRCIVVSGTARPPDAEDLRWLAKPVDLDDLIGALA